MGPETSDENFVPFYRLIWTLNTESYKTTQSLLFFAKSTDPPLDVFQASVLVVPFDSATQNLVLELPTVQQLARSFWKALSGIAPLSDVYASVGPLVMLFGQPPHPPNTGYCLEFVIRGEGATRQEAVQRWREAVGNIGTALRSTDSPSVG